MLAQLAAGGICMWWLLCLDVALSLRMCCEGLRALLVESLLTCCCESLESNQGIRKQSKSTARVDRKRLPAAGSRVFARLSEVE